MTTANAGLFARETGKEVPIVLVYVDNLIITGDSIEVVSQVKENLYTRFHMKDLGKLKHFLGLEVLIPATLL